MRRRELLTLLPALAQGAPPVVVGGRRELFVDDYLIDWMRGAELRLGTPVEKETVLRMDRPHEGPFSAYFTVLRDGGKYRLYYRGVPEAGKDGRSSETTCYAESTDGIHFEKPANNIVLQGQAPFSHNFCPFIDRNPRGGSRYKAISGIASSGLKAWVSGNGLAWRPMQDAPVMAPAKLPMFDSQNLAFWSESEECYVAYVRLFRDKVRSIARATSSDFLRWSPFVPLDLGGAPADHLYTNQIHPYFRTPHIYVGIAARFNPGRQVLSAEEARETGVHPDYFKDTSDSVLLTTRGGDRVSRYFRESFLRPGLGLNHWVSRDNYPALNIVPTSDDEMSFYVNRHYGQPTSHLQRYALRTDGLASLHAGWRGGELLTKPLVFSGKELELNFATSAAGGVRVEVLQADETAITGLGLGDCVEMIGDRLARMVKWKGALAEWAGKPVRLLFSVRDADVYSFRFV
ncbi:MAG: hypothetical protein HYX27_18540 [Acidobacteria bacterium]|nr:hypothetical protein [Acidobacteriota bacterium]